jgi:hypothetical protein
LLGFFLPYSTGNEFVLLQNARRDDWRNGERNFDATEYLVQMSLEDRLEKSVPSYSADEYGEIDTLTDGSVELALDSFLHQGLERLLSGRPFHRQQVDLIHVMAMAIHPFTTPQVIPQTAPYLNASGSERPAWIRAQLLMQNPSAQHFQIHYGHRFKIVKLIAEHLVLPVMENDVSADVVGPLLHGALVHLRASLRSFCSAARSKWEAHWAHCALVSIAVQTRNKHIVKDEWDFQLHRMVDDRTDYGCKNCHASNSLSQRLLLSPPEELIFCPHSARGQIMAVFVTQCCSQSRKYQKGNKFLGHALGSLTDAIEWQVDCSTTPVENEADPTTERHSPCLLASLLFAAKHCLYFLSSETKDNDATEDDDDHCGTLIESAIQLLRHSNIGIVREALDLLSVALTHRPAQTTNDYAWMLLETLKTPLVQETEGILVEKVVAVAAQQSAAFASFMYTFLAEKSGGDDQQQETAFRWIAALALNRPSVVAKDTDRLVSLLEKAATTKGVFHLMASLLSLRQVRYFATKEGVANQAVLRAMRRQTRCWDSYQLARHALVTGNFGVAAESYDMILGSSLNEKHFLWISALSKIAKAESSLSSDAAKGIPSASNMLRSALSYLESLNALDAKRQECHTFQIRFLLLRLDFLDLVTILRQLTREMRLTGSGPAKYTRSYLHLQNTVKSFVALSSRYRILNQQHGIRFQYAQSRHSLTALKTLCLFMGLATRAVFSDVLPVQTAKVSICSILKGSSHPMMLLIRRLDELVVQQMDSSLDPLVRAAMMLELIDGIFMVPLPFPIDFLSVKPKCLATLSLSVDPDQASEYGTSSLNAIETYPSLCFNFCATGSIPEAVLTESRLALSTVLLWYHFIYKCPLPEEDVPADDKNDDEGPSVTPKSIEKRLPDLSKFSPVTSSLFSNGRFFVPVQCPPLLEEGMYVVEVKLGAKDAGGSEWEIPVDASSRTLEIRVRHAYST